MKKLLRIFFPFFYLTNNFGEDISASVEDSDNNGTDLDELVEKIMSDRKVDGKDKQDIQDLLDAFDRAKEDELSNTIGSLSSLRETVEQSIENMLKSGYSVNNQNDYDVFASLVSHLDSNFTMPDYNIFSELGEFSLSFENGKVYVFNLGGQVGYIRNNGNYKKERAFNFNLNKTDNKMYGLYDMDNLINESILDKSGDAHSELASQISQANSVESLSTLKTIIQRYIESYGSMDGEEFRTNKMMFEQLMVGIDGKIKDLEQDKRISANEAELTELRGSIDLLTERAGKLEAADEEIRDEIRELTRKLEATKTELIDSINKTEQNLSSQISEANGKIAELTDELEALEQTVNSLNEIQRKNSQLLEDMSSDLTELTGKVNGFDDRIKILEDGDSKLGTLRDDYNELNDLVQGLKTTLDGLTDTETGEIANLQEQLAEAQSTLASLTSRIEEFEKISSPAEDRQARSESNETTNIPEGMSQDVFNLITQNDNLKIENGKVYYTYEVNGESYTNYFTISKNPSTSSQLGTNGSGSEISSLGQSTSIKQWMEACVILRTKSLEASIQVKSDANQSGANTIADLQATAEMAIENRGENSTELGDTIYSFDTWDYNLSDYTLVEVNGCYFYVSNENENLSSGKYETLKQEILNGEAGLQISTVLKNANLEYSFNESMSQDEKLSLLAGLAGLSDLKPLDLDSGESSSFESDSFRSLDLPSANFDKGVFEREDFEANIIKEIKNSLPEEVSVGTEQQVLLDAVNNILSKYSIDSVDLSAIQYERGGDILSDMTNLLGEQDIFDKVNVESEITIDRGIFEGMPQEIDDKKIYKLKSGDEEVLLTGEALKDLLNNNDSKVSRALKDTELNFRISEDKISMEKIGLTTSSIKILRDKGITFDKENANGTYTFNISGRNDIVLDLNNLEVRDERNKIESISIPSDYTIDELVTYIIGMQYEIKNS